MIARLVAFFLAASSVAVAAPVPSKFPSPLHPVSAPSAGLMNDALRLRNPALDAWDIGGDFRFRYEMKDDGESGAPRNANGYGRNPRFDSFAGSELDIVAKYAVTSWAELQLGYGHFFPGDYAKSSVGSIPVNGGATGADWVYVQTTVTF